MRCGECSAQTVSDFGLYGAVPGWNMRQGYDKMRAALEGIANPISAIQERAKRDGLQIDGRAADDRRDRIDGLTTQYVTGEISEEVYTASLRAHMDASEIRHLVMLNQLAHRNSTAYRRGDIS